MRPDCFFFGSKSSSDPRNFGFTGADNEIISQEPIHYHPELTVLVKGEKQEIPANVGIGPQYRESRFYDTMMNMTDIHTHDASGVLHWEVMHAPVRRGHLRLGNFFEIWGRSFDFSKAKMFINSEPNNELLNYLIKDGDKIGIIFE